MLKTETNDISNVIIIIMSVNYCNRTSFRAPQAKFFSTFWVVLVRNCDFFILVRLLIISEFKIGLEVTHSKYLWLSSNHSSPGADSASYIDPAEIPDFSTKELIIRN